MAGIPNSKLDQIKEAMQLRVADWDGSAFFANTDAERILAIQRMTEAERALGGALNDVVYIANRVIYSLGSRPAEVPIPETPTAADKPPNIFAEEELRAWLEERSGAEIRLIVDRFLLPPKADPASTLGVSTSRFRFLGTDEE